MYNKSKPRGWDPQKDHDLSGSDFIFGKGTNVNETRSVKRFPQQHTEELRINSLAEKIPIHQRNQQKSLTPTSLYGSQQYPEEEEIGVLPVRENSAYNLGQAKTRPIKMSSIFTGDRVVFTENPSLPGVPVVYRAPEEKASYPDKLNLDRRKLTVCPILEGEDQLRLLNYQHNFITHIQNISSLKRLIFLDLYDNHVEEIAGLSSLKGLRVLMLGKNRIKRIENLDSLLKLDVLDLHGNQISRIENLKHLTELRVLNLAGNVISHVDELVGLDSLVELNLRRNKIRTVSEIDMLPNLQRLFLSFNEITCFEDVQCLGESVSLSEISFDGNPITQDINYKYIILRNMHQVKLLDLKRVTEEERRQALLMAKKEGEKQREMDKIAILKEKKRLAIKNVKRQWEIAQISQMSKTSRLAKQTGSMPDLFASHIGSFPNSETDLDGIEGDSLTSSDCGSRPDSAHSNLLETLDDQLRNKNLRKDPRFKAKDASKDVNTLQNTIIDEGLNMMVNIDNGILSLYGNLSLETNDKNRGFQSAGAVHTIIFQFIDFDAIVKQLPRLRAKFPATNTLVFQSTNIHSLQQINALSSLRRLDNLTIDLDGNPVTKFPLWRMYAIFRLAHFALKKINDVEVSSSDIVNAEKLFGPLSQMVITHLPQYRYMQLTGDVHKKHISSEVKKVNETGKGNTDKSQVELTGRTGLTYTVSSSKQNSSTRSQLALNIAAEVMKDSSFHERKQKEVLKVWPNLVIEMLQNAVADVKSMDIYMKCALAEIEKR